MSQRFLDEGFASAALMKVHGAQPYCKVSSGYPSAFTRVGLGSYQEVSTVPTIL